MAIFCLLSTNYCLLKMQDQTGPPQHGQHGHTLLAHHQQHHAQLGHALFTHLQEQHQDQPGPPQHRQHHHLVPLKGMMEGAGQGSRAA